MSPALLPATTSAMPINLNVSKAAQISQGLQIISTSNNNNITTNKILNCKNGVRTTIDHQQQTQQTSLHNIIGNGREMTKVEASKKPENEPPTKVLKLINGSTILASVVDKDHKLIPAGLTLQQVRCVNQCLRNGLFKISSFPIAGSFTSSTCHWTNTNGHH